MRKELLILSLATAAATQVKAQVEDVSVIITPTLSYNWFDSKSTVENGLMYGFQAGFGFGKFIELRGVYERSSNLHQRFGQYEDDIRDLLNNQDFKFQDRKVNVTRIGGEFKSNIQLGGLSPYIILGTGVQTLERTLTNDKVYKNQNIYGTGGLGFKINMGDRVTLNLEGRGLVYNMNPGSLLYNPGESSEFDEWINNQERDRMYNWSATAGLQFYLGGRRSSELTAMDRAYLRRFSGGLSALKLTLAPVGAYVDFNEKSPFRSAYFLGGQLGLDFTDYVGLRGYYYHATEDKNPSFNFDKMAMYGVDFVGRLNVPRGIVPYITIGGGYIDVSDDYKGKNLGNNLLPIYAQASSTYYAKAGVGLEVPLGTYVDAFGAANLLYTVDEKATSIGDLRNVEQLRRHTSYNVGLRLKMGKRANTEYAAQQAFYNRFAGDRYEYENRIAALEQELKTAYENNDVQRITEIIEEKKVIESTPQTVNQQQPEKYIKMTPAELESLIDRVIKGVEEESETSVESRIERLEFLLMHLQNGPRTGYREGRKYNYGQDAEATELNPANERLIAEIKRLNQQLDEQRNTIDKLQQKQSKMDELMVTNATAPRTSQVVVEVHDDKNANNATDAVVLNLDKSLAVFAGLGFGKASSFNLGVRSYQTFANTSFMFVPEAYIALGDKFGLGVSANGIVPFRINSLPNFAPYAGVGVGLNLMDGDLSVNPNFIVGAAQHMGQGSAFVDYTVRGAFKYNQLAVGYRFRF